LVELAEAKLRGEPVDTHAYSAAVAGLFDQPGGDRIDVVVNACTHFPLVSDEIAAVAPHAVRFVDGAAGIARRVAHLTAGQEWPETPEHRAVFTRLGEAERHLVPALARYGITRIEAL
jgi:glutamate racemase